MLQIHNFGYLKKIITKLEEKSYWFFAQVEMKQSCRLYYLNTKLCFITFTKGFYVTSLYLFNSTLEIVFCEINIQEGRNYIRTNF